MKQLEEIFDYDLLGIQESTRESYPSYRANFYDTLYKFLSQKRQSLIEEIRKWAEDRKSNKHQWVTTDNYQAYYTKCVICDAAKNGNKNDCYPDGDGFISGLLALLDKLEEGK